MTSDVAPVGGICGQLEAAVAGLDVASVPVEQLDAVAGGFARIERLAAAGKVLVAARLGEVARAGTLHRDGAALLASESGTSVGAARRVIETAGRLGALPLVAAAVRAGALSAEQAQVVAEAATASPGEEARLVELAQGESLKALREEARRVIAAADPATDEERAAEVRRTRRLSSWTNGEGGAEGGFAGPVEDMAEINAALDAHQEAIFAEARAAGSVEPFTAYRWDAWLRMARASVRGGHPTKPIAKKILVRADEAALARGQVCGGEVCDIPGCGPIPASVAQKLLQGSTWHALLTKGADVCTVTNGQRPPLSIQRSALEWSQPLCCVEGCDNVARLQIDHMHERRHGGRTNTRNLQHLCTYHHDLKTRFGWTYQDQPGGRRKRPVPPAQQAHHARSSQAPTRSAADDHNPPPGERPPPGEHDGTPTSPPQGAPPDSQRPPGPPRPTPAPSGTSTTSG
jgi:hypothetical protein